MKTNVKKLLNENQELMRMQVIEQELSARSWKAYYEKMYFSIESEKLEPLYKEHQERMKLRREQELKKMGDSSPDITE